MARRGRVGAWLDDGGGGETCHFRYSLARRGRHGHGARPRSTAKRCGQGSLSKSTIKRHDQEPRPWSRQDMGNANGTQSRARRRDPCPSPFDMACAELLGEDACPSVTLDQCPWSHPWNVFIASFAVTLTVPSAVPLLAHLPARSLFTPAVADRAILARGTLAHRAIVALVHDACSRL